MWPAGIAAVEHLVTPGSTHTAELRSAKAASLTATADQYLQR